MGKNTHLMIAFFKNSSKIAQQFMFTRMYWTKRT